MLPSALSALDEITSLQNPLSPAFFFDFDGTLTPIVDRPELAYLSEVVRITLASLARQSPVAIVSGRDRIDVEKRVRLKSVFYAGSHGLDIIGPEASRWQPEKSDDFLPLLLAAKSSIEKSLQGIEGIQIETKAFSFSVHYRLASEQSHERVKTIVQDTLRDSPTLKSMEGKRVLEVLPAIDWDKGKAVLWLLEKLKTNGSNGYFPIFIGDDLTDEMAFKAVREKGIGILVSDQARESAASFQLLSVTEVHRFIGIISDRLMDSN